jgi:prolyl-tRNA synthetase
VHLDDRDVRPGAKHYDWEIKGVPIRLEIGPRDLASGNCVVTLRTGGKSEIPLDGITQTMGKLLESVSDELRVRSHSYASELIRPFPGLIKNDTGWHPTHPLEDGIIYELGFDGNDAHAEILEKATGLTLLGDCVAPYDEPVNCAVTGKPTIRRQHLAKMY